MQDAGYRMQDAGCRMHDTGCRMWDAGSRMLDDGHRLYRLIAFTYSCSIDSGISAAVIPLHDRVQIASGDRQACAPVRSVVPTRFHESALW